MLIELTDMAIATVQNIATHGAGRLALENLLTAHREGKHIVLLPANARWLTADHRISEVARGMARTIMSKRSEIDGLRKQLRHYIEVREAGYRNQSERRGHQTVHSVGIDWFSDSQRIQPAIILGENQKDAELAFLFAQAFSSHKRWQLRISVELRGGGGSTIADEFVAACSLGRPVLSLVDSDKTHPGCAMGATAARFVEIVDRETFQETIISESREIENAIPPLMINEALSTRGQILAPDIAQHVHCREQARDDWHRYLDLKRGLVGYDIFVCSNDDEKNHLVDVERRLQLVGIKKSCNTTMACDERSSCRCSLVPGLGKGFLALLVASLSKISPSKIAEWAHFEDNVDISTIAESTLSFGCAFARSIV